MPFPSARPVFHHVSIRKEILKSQIVCYLLILPSHQANAMYRTNSQPLGCEGPHPQVQAKACLSSPRWARLRAFIRSTSAAARCLTPFPSPPPRSHSGPYIYSPSLHRPTSLGCSWCVRPRGVSILLCILHPASKPIVGCFSLSCIHHFSVSPKAVSLSRSSIHPLQTSYRPIPLVSSLSSRPFFRLLCRPVSVFVIFTFRHHRISSLSCR